VEQESALQQAGPRISADNTDIDGWGLVTDSNRRLTDLRVVV